MTPETFKYLDKEYRSVARARRMLLGVRDLDTCCREWVCINSTGNAFKKIGNKNKIRIHAIYAFSLLVYNDAIAAVPADEFTLDGIVVPKFTPTDIPGTSGDVSYKTLISTEKGFVAHRGDKKLASNPRIRIAKNDQTEEWKPGSLKLSAGLSWQTQAATHLAHSGGTDNETKVLIARGLDAIFQLEAI